MLPQETFFIANRKLALLGLRVRKRPVTQSTPSATETALAATREDRSSLAGSTMLEAAKPSSIKDAHSSTIPRLFLFFSS